MVLRICVERLHLEGLDGRVSWSQGQLEGCEWAVAMEEGCEWTVPLVQRVCLENLNAIYFEIAPASSALSGAGGVCFENLSIIYSEIHASSPRSGGSHKLLSRAHSHNHILITLQWRSERRQICISSSIILECWHPAKIMTSQTKWLKRVRRVLHRP